MLSVFYISYNLFYTIVLNAKSSFWLPSFIFFHFLLICWFCWSWYTGLSCSHFQLHVLFWFNNAQFYFLIGPEIATIGMILRYVFFYLEILSFFFDWCNIPCTSLKWNICMLSSVSRLRVNQELLSWDLPEKLLFRWIFFFLFFYYCELSRWDGSRLYFFLLVFWNSCVIRGSLIGF